jgi:hypothetical protein
MPQSMIEYRKKYGDAINSNGYLPYIVLDLVDSLTKVMKRKDWPASKKIAADLGHYTADLLMPFNTTMNYDGQLTKNAGIKWRYEIEFINRYSNQINFKRPEPRKIDKIFDAIVGALAKSYNRILPILRADSLATRNTKGKFGSSYYAGIWKDVGGYTADLLQDASNLYSNLLYTAWMNAGGTKLQWNPDAANGMLKNEFLYLEQNYPNPFNSKTSIKYSIPGDVYVRLGVFNIFGQQLEMLFEGRQQEGRYAFNFNGENYPGGVYFIQLQMDGRIETRKMILAK